MTGGTTGVHAMAQAEPSLEAIAAQLRAFSRAKGGPVSEREWNAHPARLCGATTVRRRFRQPWNAILRTCGVTPRDTRDPAYVAHWVLAFYAREQRWPRRRDFKRPCSHWVVKRVFRDADNAVAAAVQLAQDTLRRLTREGVTLTHYLAHHFLTVPPHRSARRGQGRRRPRATAAPRAMRPSRRRRGVRWRWWRGLYRWVRRGPWGRVFRSRAPIPTTFPTTRRNSACRAGRAVPMSGSRARSAARRTSTAGVCDDLVCRDADRPVAVPNPPAPDAHVVTASQPGTLSPEA
jgi:hypothetical protein